MGVEITTYSDTGGVYAKSTANTPYFIKQFPDHQFELMVTNQADHARIFGKTEAELKVSPEHLRIKPNVTWEALLGIAGVSGTNSLQLPNLADLVYTGSSMYESLGVEARESEFKKYYDSLAHLDYVLHDHNKHLRVLACGQILPDITIHGVYKTVAEAVEPYKAEYVIPIMLLDSSVPNSHQTPKLTVLGMIAALGPDGLWRGHEVMRTSDFFQQYLPNTTIYVRDAAIIRIANTLAIIEAAMVRTSTIATTYDNVKFGTRNLALTDILENDKRLYKPRMTRPLDQVGFNLHTELDPARNTAIQKWIPRVLQSIP